MKRIARALRAGKKDKKKNQGASSPDRAAAPTGAEEAEEVHVCEPYMPPNDQEPEREASLSLVDEEDGDGGEAHKQRGFGLTAVLYQDTESEMSRGEAGGTCGSPW